MRPSRRVSAGSRGRSPASSGRGDRAGRAAASTGSFPDCRGPPRHQAERPAPPGAARRLERREAGRGGTVSAETPVKSSFTAASAVRRIREGESRPWATPRRCASVSTEQRSRAIRRAAAAAGATFVKASAAVPPSTHSSATKGGSWSEPQLAHSNRGGVIEQRRQAQPTGQLPASPVDSFRSGGRFPRRRPHRRRGTMRRRPRPRSGPAGDRSRAAWANPTKPARQRRKDGDTSRLAPSTAAPCPASSLPLGRRQGPGPAARRPGRLQAGRDPAPVRIAPAPFALDLKQLVEFGGLESS